MEDADDGQWWDEKRILQLLAEDGPTLYVSGTVSNQGRFYDRFDAVVLLSAPADVLLDRIATRTTNDYGKSLEERELILSISARSSRCCARRARTRSTRRSRS